MQYTVTLGGASDREGAEVSHTLGSLVTADEGGEEGPVGHGRGGVHASGNRDATEVAVGEFEGEEPARRRLTALPTNIPTTTTEVNYDNAGYTGTVREAANIPA